MLIKKFNRRRILLVVLSILLIIVVSDTTKITAATTDDLREVIGDKRVTDESLVDDLKTIIYRYRQTEYKKKLVDMLDTMGDFGYEKSFDKLLLKKEYSLNTLEKSFCSNQKAEVIFEKLSNSISVLNELGALEIPNNYVLDEFGDEDYKDAFNYASSVLKTIGDDYNIGEIGEGVTFPTKNSSKLYRAYGKNAIVNSSITYEENQGIDLYVATSTKKDFKAKIVSQFNGTVLKVEKKDIGKYKITIKHGVTLITVYEYLSSVVVKKGDKVKQYDLLGYSSEETLHFEVLLNTVPINPLLMYGDLGEQVFSVWLGTYPGMAVEKVDFSKTKKHVKSTINKNKKDFISPSTVVENGKEKRKIIQEEGYIKPSAPIVEYIEKEKGE